MYDSDLLENQSNLQSVRSSADAGVVYSAEWGCSVDAGPDLVPRCELPNARSVCSEGECRIVSCVGDFRDCNQAAADGCEASINDPNNCGLCGRSCVIPHGTGTCENGSCKIAHCDEDWADCDDDGKSCEMKLVSSEACGACGQTCQAGCLDGSCVTTSASVQDCASADLQHDIAHCGSCNNACRFTVESPNAGLSCLDGQCRAVCQDGWEDCDNDYHNGCEQSLKSAEHCGGCGVVCSAAHGEAACVDGQCVIEQCDDFYDDCDEDGLSCEQSLVTADHCGKCGSACGFAHARATCTRMPGMASCSFQSCERGWDDCDNKLTENGCERDVRSVADGGNGPCLPDPSCSVYALRGTMFYVCTAEYSWDAANAACHKQRNGHLVTIDSPERGLLVTTLILSRLGRIWAGHNDKAQEGTWVWDAGKIPFWQGAADGMSISNRYEAWASGEPNTTPDDPDCGAFESAGTFDAEPCSWTQGFVCEVSPDE